MTVLSPRHRVALGQRPVYTAYETADQAEALGIVVCSTPPYSPESNGMAESFVKDFKRDYV